MSRLLMIVAATALSLGSAHAQFVPFYTFLDNTRSAAASDYVGKPGNRVADAAEFEKMRQAILDMYGNAHVARSFLLKGQNWDCIPMAEQPAFLALGADTAASPPPYPPTRPDGTVVPAAPSQIEPNQKVDTAGNAIGCLPGEVPIIRYTLEDVTRFERLDQFGTKSPAFVDGTHKYAYASQLVTNYGASTTINIWSPQVTPPNQLFSLSQLWVAYRGNPTQTVEAGWQVSPMFLGKNNTDPNAAVLFVYWTPNNYKTACYNISMTCKVFVQRNSSVYLGLGFIGYSSPGVDNQWEFSLTYHLHNGNWWIAYGSTWFGYYPGSIFNKGPLATHSSEVDFGGEVDDYSPNWGPMGSGVLATTPVANNFGSAAFQRLIWYYKTKTSTTAANLTPVQASKSCWTDLVGTGVVDGLNWGTYTFFGGPGGSSC